MENKAEVKIAAAKGRPMLTWVGKRPLSRVVAFPAQHVENFDPGGTLAAPPAKPDLWKDWPAAFPRGGLLFHGDNKEVLAYLLANGFRGAVNLIYIDPPYDSGADYVRQVTLRGVRGSAKIGGEQYTLGEQIQYTDIWANDNYLQFMYERLLLLKELLSENGSIYVHMDESQGHYMKVVLDEVFGREGFRRECIWDITVLSGFKSIAENWIRGHEAIFYYTKSGEFIFNKQRQPHRKEYLDRFDKTDEDGRRYFDGRGERRYLDDVIKDGKAVGDVWYDIMSFQQIPTATERGDYPTQKPEDLLKRIILSSSNPGDLVFDCFVGSGTTVAVAQTLGRRWIGCDINKGAVQATAKRLQTIIGDQLINVGKKNKPKQLAENGEETNLPDPAQLAFTTWRVNDYDLAIQHNEAVNLACEHVGVERTRIDGFFDGTLGRSLVKVIPFGHPLTPLDLEEIKRELEARPEEDRAVTVICLGMELAAAAWLEEWNRLRKGKDAVNPIDVIELRTDPKYGKFIRHEPARARVKATRAGDNLVVVVEDFISPTIVERLEQQAGVVSPKIDDWRAMVDCVAIDVAYDGKVFNVALSDVPAKKTDFVVGRYELPVPPGPTTVAVKIVDMLGEEVLVVEAGV